MTLYVIGFVIVFLMVLASGIQVGFGLGFLALGLMTIYTDLDTALSTGVEKAYASLDTSTLVAIPLFILTAQLISETGMGKRLFDAAKAFMGRMRSGLGAATILSSGVFAAMTGSSFVSASTMGLIAIPELRKARYTDTMIAAAITAGGSLGSVIPPSLVMIVYGYLTDESVGKLFMAGMIPGLLLIFLYSFALALFSKKPAESRETLSEVIGTGISVDQALRAESLKGSEGAIELSKMAAMKEAFWGLMAPIIILGGIYLGIFTASEAAAVSAVYCIIIGMFVYRTISISKLWQILLSAANISAMVAVIVMAGVMMGHGVVFGRIPQQILELIIAHDFSPLTLLIIVNMLLFVMGMFLESLSLMYLAIPLLYPVVLHMGWDNIWFAVILLINVNLGLITPPMGGVLYIVSQIGAIPIGTVIKGAMLPVIILLLVLVLVIIFPAIATWLPSLM
jgi:C4-dicarboxylate transporter DctM subunit